MRINYFGLNAGNAALLSLLLAVCLITAPLSISADEDFDDDEIKVEDVEETSTPLTDENGEELVYESPKYDPSQFHFIDHFDDIEESRKRWTQSQAKKDDTSEEIAKYDGKWSWEAPQRIVWKKDIGLVLKSKAKHAAISAPLSKPFTFKEEKPLIVQYEVTLQEGQDCGGSYIKLLSQGKAIDDLTKFNDKTPYTIMFGPDKCGNDVKMHFIFRHVNPINGSISEKHCRKPKDRLEAPFRDKLPHLYQLVIRPDNTFEVRVDHNIINEGSLLDAFTPPVNPPREIDDPEDKKPETWDEREKIPDPTARKPADWNEDEPPQIPDATAVKPDNWLEFEPEMIPDPSAIKPDDWDAEIDGEWEAPLVDNPVCEKVAGCGKWKAPLIPNKAYKGKWRAPLIENPNYQGKWAPRKIPNPDFFEDLTPFKMTPISAVGIEIWSMSSDILFDNLVVTDDILVAQEFAAKTFDIKRKYIDKESETFLSKYLPQIVSENPWALGVAVLTVICPLAFTLYRFLLHKGKQETTEDSKKTDAVQPDDDEATTSAAAAAATAGSAVNDLKSSPKTKSSAANSGGGDSEMATADRESSVDADDDEKVGDVDKSEENNDDTNEDSEGSGDKATAVPRKRRVRKDQS